MSYLLDTNVLSEIRRADGSAVVKRRVGQIPGSLAYISVLSLGEIVRGISLLALGRKRSELEFWYANLIEEYSDRILPVELDTSVIWGEMTSRLQKRGITVPLVEGLLAATAQQHRLVVLTRNTRDFEECGVEVVNPWIEEQ